MEALPTLSRIPIDVNDSARIGRSLPVVSRACEILSATLFPGALMAHKWIMECAIIPDYSHMRKYGGQSRANSSELEIAVLRSGNEQAMRKCKWERYQRAGWRKKGQ